jgi:Spy/CpxP family protein refolding chaperone
MRRLATLTCALFLATAALAGPGGEPRHGPMARRGMGGLGMGGPMEHNLFPPELILMNQLALGLSAEQVDAIKKQVGDTHGRVLDAQVDLHRVTEQLRAALESPKVDEAAVLAFASQAMDLEKKVKTAHLTLMIRVKNVLTADQQDKARALAPHHAEGPTPPSDED